MRIKQAIGDCAVTAGEHKRHEKNLAVFASISYNYDIEVSMIREPQLLSELTADEQQLVKMVKALGNPLRFRIMQYLAQNQACITGDIVSAAALAQSTVSQHLKVLVEAGLIEGEIDGPATCYCVSAEGLRFLKTEIGRWLPDCCQPESEPDSSQPSCC
jgi:ArsR family transcriptional regulator, arsenate/arsenite/antimonite-responsive transcriptional repressor